MLDPHEMFQDQPNVIEKNEGLLNDVAGAYKKAESASLNLVEAISWYVWQNVQKQYSNTIAKLEDRVDALERNLNQTVDRVNELDDDEAFKEQVYGQVEVWMNNNLDDALDRICIVDKVCDSYTFRNEVDARIDDADYEEKFRNIIRDDLASHIKEVICDELTFEVSVS